MNDQDAFVGYHLRMIEERLSKIEQGLVALLKRSTLDDVEVHELTLQLEASTNALATAVSANQPPTA